MVGVRHEPLEGLQKMLHDGWIHCCLCARRRDLPAEISSGIRAGQECHSVWGSCVVFVAQLVHKTPCMQVPRRRYAVGFEPLHTT